MGGSGWNLICLPAELSHLLATVIWPLFEKLFEEGSGLRYLEEVLYYLFKASSPLKEEEVVQQVKNLLSYEEAHEVLMTVAEQLEQKGLQISCKRFPWQGQFSPPCVSLLRFPLAFPILRLFLCVLG